jgi:outer membrane protein OmpA-like peptidoglycan-associated protein
MKRLYYFIGAAALVAVAMTASPALKAQENGNRDENGKVVRGPYETNRFGDNWFIGAGGGVNLFLNEGYDPVIGPSIDANLGKWFTPSVGMRVGYQGFKTNVSADNATQNFGYMYFHGDFLWNMSNALGGYKETRFWNLVPYAHAGYFRTYGLNGSEFYDNEIAAGAGLLHNLRLIDRLDLIIDMRATVMNGRAIGTDGVSLLPSVTAGLAVDLGFPNFVRTSTVVAALELANAEKFAILEAATLALEAANLALEEENMDLEKANAALAKENSALKKKPSGMDFTAFFENMSPATVYFEIGQAVLNDKEMEHLDFIAKNIVSSADKNTKIYLTLLGTADGNTGTMRRNQHLSEARAKYIYDILTAKYNISKERLIIKSEVVRKAAKPALSRAVVISF